jgi:hypothetical protein
MFESPDPDVIREWGRDVIFTPAASPTVPYTVQMVRDEDAPEGEALHAPLLVLFGTLDDSGFTDQEAPTPQKNDTVEWDGETYRIYDVKMDDAGGTEGTAGLWLYLDAVGE